MNWLKDNDFELAGKAEQVRDKLAEQGFLEGNQRVLLHRSRNKDRVNWKIIKEILSDGSEQHLSKKIKADDKVSLRSVSMDGLQDSEFQKAFEETMRKYSVLEISDITWEKKMRSGSYAFTAALGSGGMERDIFGIVFHAVDTRRRPDNLYELMKRLNDPQFSQFIVVTPMRVLYPASKSLSSASKVQLERKIALFYLKGDKLPTFAKNLFKIGVTHCWREIYRQLFSAIQTIHRSGYSKLSYDIRRLLQPLLKYLSSFPFSSW